MSALDTFMNMSTTKAATSDFDAYAETERAKVLLEKIQSCGYALLKDGKPTEMLTMLTTKNNQAINAIAGGGKTTALIFKLIFDLENNELRQEMTTSTGMSFPMVKSTLVCTYLKSGATELESAFKNWQTKLNSSPTENIKFSTLDAEFKNCLEAMGVKVEIGEDERLFHLFKRAVDMANLSNEKYSVGDMDDNDYRNLYALTTMWRCRLDKTSLNLRSNDTDITAAELDRIVYNFATLRDQAHIMDFTEIMELLYKYLYITPMKKIQDYVASRYDYIYIDEFQDTSQLAYAILKFYARDSLSLVQQNDCEARLKYNVDIPKTGTKIVFVGDVSQCIYTFRGSDSHIIVHLAVKDFAPNMTSLSVNWRCPANILNPIIPSIHMNYDSKDQVITAAKQGGEFKALHFDSVSTMANYLVDNVYKDIQEGLSVAVLCRTNYDGALPAFLFEMNSKFNYSISNKSMTLATAIPQKVLGFRTLFTERFSKDIASSLSLLVPANQWNVKRQLDAAIENSKKDNESFLWDSNLDDIGYSISEDLKDFIAEVRKRGNNLQTLRWVYAYLITIYKEKSTSRYAKLIVAYAEIIRDLLDDYLSCADNKYYIVKDGINYNLDGSVKKIVLRDTRIKAENVDTSISTAFGKITEIDGNYFVAIQDELQLDDAYNYPIYEDGGDIFEFAALIDNINERLEQNIKKKYYQATITTVHEYKGKEADSVYIWNDTEGVFPSKKENTLLTSVEAEAEERRLHYVACTRAKQKETILAIKGMEGMFTKEMDLTFVDPTM